MFGCCDILGCRWVWCLFGFTLLFVFGSAFVYLVALLLWVVIWHTRCRFALLLVGIAWWFAIGVV